jgi:enolase
MTLSAIRDVHAWEALDSRGKPTVAAAVELADGARGRAVVPSGASTGGHEAVERRDGGDRYGGQGVLGAVAAANTELRDRIIGLDATDQQAVDAALESCDPRADLGTVGANAVLALSLATLLAAADSTDRPLWQQLDGSSEPLIPMPMVNIVSGGAHARGLLDIQDVLVVPEGAASFAEAIEWVARVRQATADLLDERGGSSALVADEGGLAGSLGSNEAGLALVTDGIARSGLRPGVDVSLALDLAANQLWTGERYALRVEKRELTADEWLSVVAGWCDRFPIVSIEDALFEDDWAGWATASSSIGVGRQLLGDDLFATNDARVERGVAEGVANAVLVKPNQAGSVSRAAAVVRRAHAAAYGTVVSARSGDTEDTWLADLAIGWRARQIKVGSTMRSERTAKWNRVLEIESRADGRSVFAGRDALAGRR